MMVLPQLFWGVVSELSSGAHVFFLRMLALGIWPVEASPSDIHVKIWSLQK